MVGEIDYISLLKCARCLKQRIDDLVNKNPEQISAWEVKCTRKEIDKMLKKYFIRTEFIKSSNNHSQTNPKYNNNAENSTKFKTNEHIYVLSGIGSKNDDILNNNCAKQNMDEYKKPRNNVTKDEGNTNKQNCEEVHKKCHGTFKLYEEYIQELECRLKEVTNFMGKKQRTDQKNIPKDTNFDIMISKMKNNENHNKAEIRKLSKELECERKKSEAYHNWADEAFSKIKKLSQTATQISTDSASLSKSLKLVVVDLPISVCDDHGDGRPTKSPEVKYGKRDTSRYRSQLMIETPGGSKRVQLNPIITLNQRGQRPQYSANRGNRSRNSSRANGQVDDNCVNYDHSISHRDMTSNKWNVKNVVPQSQPSSKYYRKNGGNDGSKEIEMTYYISEDEELLATSDSSYTSASGTGPNNW